MKKDLWRVISDSYPKVPETIMQHGNIYQIANGYMGYRGTLDEFRSEQLVGITLAGIFDQVGNAWREPVNAPNGGFTRLILDNEIISTLETEILSHSHSINLKNAVFERNTLFACKEKTVRVKSSRFLSTVNPNLMLIEYSFSCDSNATISIQTGIDYSIWDLNGPHLVDFNPKQITNCLMVSANTQELGKQICVTEVCEFSEGEEAYIAEDNLLLRNIKIDAKAGEVYTIRKYISVVKEGDLIRKSLSDTALDVVKSALQKGFEECLAEHNRDWLRRWNLSDVVIEGDDKAQIALRYSIFQLLIVAPEKGSSNSIPARALSGQVYKGAIFWDTEMFMLPFFLHTHPDTAIELLRYRIKTLDGARRKAKTEGPGYRGAYYAWESQDTGDDACTYFNVGDPITKRELRTHFRDKQIHISGDVAIAIWKYFEITGDDSLLREGGTDVILECARFYYSYIYFKKEKNRYEVLDVIGPDEYHERVHNNAFTNVIVKTTFEIACKLTQYMELHHPNEYARILADLNIESEIPMFKEAADHTYIPQPNEDSKVIEQFDTYFKLKAASVEDLKNKLIHPNEYWGAGQGIAVPTQVIKQADVVMMLSMLGGNYSEEIKRANWEYYEPRTEHGSSLSACAYAILAAEIDKLDWAYTYFMKTATIDLVGKSKLYAGTIFIGGSHPAANGGAWMTAIFGFAGVQTDAESIKINPRLYKKWKSIQFKLVHKSAEFSIQINHEEVQVDANTNNTAPGKFTIGGKDKLCQPGSTLVVSIK